jgi:hypothetical protein
MAPRTPLAAHAPSATLVEPAHQVLRGALLLRDDLHGVGEDPVLGHGARDSHLGRLPAARALLDRHRAEDRELRQDRSTERHLGAVGGRHLARLLVEEQQQQVLGDQVRGKCHEVTVASALG